MKVTGNAIMHAPPGQVWAALHDPAVLVEAIPGCQRLEPTGPDAYRFTIAAGIASLQGVYTGDIALSDREEPRSFVLTANGAGGPGTVSISVRFRLTSGGDGTTGLGYDADGVVGGLIAGVGQRLVSGVAQRMARDFFRSVDSSLSAGNAAAAGRPAPPATEDGAPPARQAADERQPGSGQGEFLRYAVVGTAATLAGVVIGRVLGRRSS
jgi:uncharacterized protein